MAPKGETTRDSQIPFQPGLILTKQQPVQDHQTGQSITQPAQEHQAGQPSPKAPNLSKKKAPSQDKEVTLTNAANTSKGSLNKTNLAGTTSTATTSFSKIDKGSLEKTNLIDMTPAATTSIPKDATSAATTSISEGATNWRESTLYQEPVSMDLDSDEETGKEEAPGSTDGWSLVVPGSKEYWETR